MSKQLTRRPTKNDRRQEKREEQVRIEAERKKRRRNILFTIVGLLAATAAVVALFVYVANSGSQTETVTNPAYPKVDNIFCDTQTPVYHIHAYLDMYINGSKLPLPKDIGIASDGSCNYWLHTHDTSGVIHIESPSQRIFTLGNFVDEWAQVFPALGYPPELDLSTTNWVAYVNGKLYSGDFHSIPLNTHAIITLVYNSPNAKPTTTYPWNGL
jgi:hypothetical protein